MQISDYLDRADVARFTARSDFHGWRLVLGNWLAIAAIFAVAGAYPNPVTIVLAVILLAGRQLGLSVLMHECGHRTLFRTAALNDVVGQWLCALAVMSDLPSYARGHLLHHRNAGTAADPDLPNYRAYPISRQSFRRKLTRDLTGQTGIKLLGYILRGASGAISAERRSSAKPFLQQLLVQLVIFALLYSLGAGWLYLLWAVAFLTVFIHGMQGAW